MFDFNQVTYMLNFSLQDKQSPFNILLVSGYLTMQKPSFWYSNHIIPWWHWMHMVKDLGSLLYTQVQFFSHTLQLLTSPREDSREAVLSTILWTGWPDSPLTGCRPLGLFMFGISYPELEDWANDLIGPQLSLIFHDYSPRNCFSL